MHKLCDGGGLCMSLCVCVCGETERVAEREREGERENSNLKTLFYKDCSLGSVKNQSNN